MTWEPLLRGGLAEGALETIEDIAKALERPRRIWFPRTALGDYAAVLSMSLDNGDAGLALFFGYLHQVLGQQQYKRLSSSYLDRSLRALQTLILPASLYEGFAGPVWCHEYLRKNVKGKLAIETAEDIDEILISYLTRSEINHHFDLVTGLVGLGVYFLERLPWAGGKRGAGLVVERLEEMAQTFAPGITWHTPPERLNKEIRGSFPMGRIDLGLAHGLPGVIAFLAIAYRCDVERKRTLAMLEASIVWLLAQRLPEMSEAAFPQHAFPKESSLPLRQAWCYGDCGIALSLLCAGRDTGRQEWEEAGVNIAIRAANSVLKECKVYDPFFCHGACGIAHIFNRFFQATRKDIFAAAAIRSIEKTMSFKGEQGGIAGFVSRVFVGDEGTALLTKPGILYGVAGVGLSLAAAVSEIEPKWDRMLLLDVPLSITNTEQ